jgi:formylmethanofuran dehydrogenase subunit A
MNDTQLYRSEMYNLYDPHHSPLTQLTSGPDKMSAVPMVDAAILTAYKNREMNAEIMDNLNTVGASFGIDSHSLASIHSAVNAAREARNNPNAISRMNHHLEKAGFGAYSGMCVPDAIGQMS